MRKHYTVFLFIKHILFSKTLQMCNYTAFPGISLLCIISSIYSVYIHLCLKVISISLSLFEKSYIPLDHDHVFYIYFSCNTLTSIKTYKIWNRIYIFLKCTKILLSLSIKLHKFAFYISGSDKIKESASLVFVRNNLAKKNSWINIQYRPFVTHSQAR